MTGELIVEHTMSLTLIVTALAFAVGIGLFGFWRYLPRNASTLGLALLRLLTIALLGWCLLLPSLKQVMTEIRKPRFIVALDQSASMSMTPGSAEALRPGESPRQVSNSNGPLRLSVRTPGSHPGKVGSTPAGGASGGR